MTISVTDARISDKGRLELQISAPATDVASLLDECEAELARAGGIAAGSTRDDLVARYGEERFEQLLVECLMDRIGTETLGASENPLVGFPQFFLVENGYPEGPLVFQVATYEMPKGTLSSAEPLEIGPEARVPSDEAVEKALASLMRTYMAQRVTNDDREVEYGDTVKVDVEVRAGGVPVSTFSRTASSMKVDYATMPKDFIDQVVGMRPGEEKDISFTVPAIEGICPEEHYDATVRVKALYYVDVPEPTTKWIQGKFPNLKGIDDLRAAMAQNIVQRAGGLPSKEDAIDAALFERLNVEIPDELVDFIVEGIKRGEAQRMHARGLGFEEFCAANETTPEQYHEKLREMAIRDLKLSIALDALYAMKGYSLNESDVDMIFEQMAPGRGMEMKHGYIMAGRLYQVEEMAQRAKARRWLDETAKLAK
ncbi:MAG: hypothetical protein IJ111_11375 [Eggerthellaceae bacterium]|nr:hypothetical protein [Eggerthellaceae bacterium]